MKNPTLSKAIKRVPQTRLAVVSLLLLLVYLLLPLPSRAGSPTEQVRGTVDKVLTIVRSSHPTSKAQMETQRAQLVEVIYPRFDFTEMAKRSLGRHWAGRTPEEQREFVTILVSTCAKFWSSISRV